MTEPSAPPPSPPTFAVERIVPTAVRVLTDPQGFFAAMPREGGYEEPGFFALAMLVADAAVFALFALLHFHLVAMISALILIPIFGAIGVLIGSAVLMFVSRALGGDATYESSFRITAHVTVLTPLSALASVIPYLPLVVQAYAFYMTIVAVIAVHKVPEQKAWKVLGAAAAVLLLLGAWSTFTARRMAPRLHELNRRLEQNARELDKAGQNFQQQIDKAMQQMDEASKQRPAE